MNRFTLLFLVLPIVATIPTQSQTDTLTAKVLLPPVVGSVTHWSGELLFFGSRESGNWDKSTFSDPVLDTSKLVVPYTALYDLFTLARQYTTVGFENEWTIPLGKLTSKDDCILVDLGFGFVRGTIPKTSVVDQVTPISYFSTAAGHPLVSGTASYSYSIRGSYFGATVPLILEWRYGISPLALSARLGILYRIASVSAEHRYTAGSLPVDFDVASNEGRYTDFNDAQLSQSIDHRVSELVISAIPSFGFSARLPFSLSNGTDSGWGIIVGIDVGGATRGYVGLSY
ncbi:MAG TPA: hypothetical protein VMG34_03215 [Bacteroidota bacterium]|nr:hypothetical protein [Bacteroidota bacterium]